MTKILHVLTKENDALPNEIISRQRQDPERRVETTDLTQEQPDYPALLKKVFEADSVSVW
jgi:hypothetical protein